MKKFTQQRNTRWLIFWVGAAAKDIVPIDFKLPVNVTQITGVAFSPANIMGDFSNIQFGELSLQMNNSRVHPLHFEVQWRTARFSMSDLLLPLNEKVQQFSRITGFYRNYLDTAHAFKVYLRYEV